MWLSEREGGSADVDININVEMWIRVGGGSDNVDKYLFCF